MLLKALLIFGNSIIALLTGAVRDRRLLSANAILANKVLTR
ncbi:hypothetical protein GXM_05360 [Nostoc sphaeroides CCNUC1]|uniref:Uncharacterized protein n=1 Tax=Nostoc sphaeroides CCNUC1 TaxID=2653204 RepID=A0A5P8W561_9NOSO|nr:hypothetical protein GXM_05360 [Nostoc sphaeroides CCNUC1]